MIEKGAMLQAMEHVVANPDEEADMIPLHDRARKLFDADPEKFMRMLATLERAHSQAQGEDAKAKGAKREKGPEETDVGSERCLALCEGLIEKWSKEATT